MHMPQLFPVIICMFYFFIFFEFAGGPFLELLSKLVNYYAKQEEVKLNKCLFFHILLI